MQKKRVFLLKDKYDTYGEIKYFEGNFKIHFYDTVFRYNHTPAMVSLFASQGVYDLDGTKALKWIQARLIPPNRQNIAEILAKNGMTHYSEVDMLAKLGGRCVHDDMWVEEVTDNDGGF